MKLSRLRRKSIPSETAIVPAEIDRLSKKMLPAMIRAAHASSRVLRKYYSRTLEVSEKKNEGLVTNADLESEAACMKILKSAARDFKFLSEESSPNERQPFAGGRWVIDPLDGTTNFVHRFPMFCVSIGLEYNGQIIAGVIDHPILRETYAARLGNGAYLNKKKISVSKTARLRDSLLTTGFTYRKDNWLRQEMEAFERLSATARAVRRPGSAALDLAYVARGVFDGFWERRLSPWDVAAGILIVREAGGMVTNFKNQPAEIFDREILVSNRILHEDLRASVAPELCELPRT
jgi:myo-inositol-1(or 4)-monophosphatase